MPSLKRLSFYYGFLLFYLTFQIFFIIILRQNNQDTHNAIKILEIYKQLIMKLEQPSAIDNSGVYKIFKMKSSKAISPDDITIITQCSPNHFASVDDLLKTWEGPISIAIYSEVPNLQTTLWDMARLFHCNNWRDFQMQLVLPLQRVYEIDSKFGDDYLSSVGNSVSCSSPFMSSQIKTINYDWDTVYPINFLRNVAKKECSTDYILVIDIDMVPNPTLRNDFLNFTKITPKVSEKVVYVVPAFETSLDVPVPINKTNLIKLFFHFKARPFYAIPCNPCHRLTNYKDWLASENHIGIKVLKRVTWKHPWEPFFIAKRNIPDYDERFKQYGMNRVSQICELHVAGFEFLILDNAFLIHKGFKEYEDFHESKEPEMEANRRIYKIFKTEIKYKYPYSERKC